MAVCKVHVVTALTSSATQVHLLELRAVRAQRVMTLRRLTERSARYSRSLYDVTSTANSDNLYVHFYAVLASSLLRSHAPQVHPCLSKG